MRLADTDVSPVIERSAQIPDLKIKETLKGLFTLNRKIHQEKVIYFPAQYAEEHYEL